MRGEDVGGTVGGCISPDSGIDRNGRKLTAHVDTEAGRVGVLEVLETDAFEVVVGGVHEVVGLCVVEDVFHVCGLHFEM